MACNAIYSVSRAARQVYQGKNSPWQIGKDHTRPLPLLAFGPGAPVFFDRHTLSLRKSGISLFTLDGRLQFDLTLTEADRERFTNRGALREIMLNRNAQDNFFLYFFFGQKEDRDLAELSDYLWVQEMA